MKVIVLGAGAIGAYYGGQLARAGHDVRLYARGENLTAIRDHGLAIRTSDGSSMVQIGATDRVDELGVADFAILGVKSYSLETFACCAWSWTPGSFTLKGRKKRVFR